MGVHENKESMEIAEDARQKEWEDPSFVANIFAGRFSMEDVFPEQNPEDKIQGDDFLEKFGNVVRENVDPDAIDQNQKTPPETLQALKKFGAFGMKIPKKYGGMGLSQTNYTRALEMLGGHCGTMTAWISAHQSIGAPQPLLVFGTEAQKEKYLPRLCQEISAFALTEPDVGSDPARMSTMATPSSDGKTWKITGQKLWCTNGSAADIIVVMCRTPDKIVNGRAKKQITAFLVEKTMPGFSVKHRCRFMGLEGIENGFLEFKDVEVPHENIIGEVGGGLRLALTTLNTGRLGLPGTCVGLGKKCLEILRHWVREREQWGTKIGNHEEIAAKVTDVAAHTFAMEAITYWTCNLVDRGGADIRLEAAMCKLFCTETSWRITNETLQARGGRGYERATSLKERGEAPIPLERMVRDIRINTILEGSTEIMHLFIAREALDMHMRLAMPLLQPHTPVTTKLLTFLRCAAFYSLWYPRQWFHWSYWPMYFNLRLGKHLRYAKRTSHRLARTIFHSMLCHGPSLERRQLLLGRIVEIGTELFVISVTVGKAHAMMKKNPSNRTPEILANLACRSSRRKIENHFRKMRSNEDKESLQLSKDVMKGKYTWLEEGTMKGNISY